MRKTCGREKKEMVRMEIRNERKNIREENAREDRREEENSLVESRGSFSLKHAREQTKGRALR